MSTVEQRLDALQRRITALEAENMQLRQHALGLPAPEQQASRRQLLAGGAGAWAPDGRHAAGTGTAGRSSSGIPHAQAVRRVTLTPLVTRGVVWAEHHWELGAPFTGAAAPVVVATAADDYMEQDVMAACTCAVRVTGEPGAYVATIMVRGIASHARAVEVHAVAIGQ